MRPASRSSRRAGARSRIPGPTSPSPAAGSCWWERRDAFPATTSKRRSGCRHERIRPARTWRWIPSPTHDRIQSRISSTPGDWRAPAWSAFPADLPRRAANCGLRGTLRTAQAHSPAPVEKEEWNAGNKRFVRPLGGKQPQGNSGPCRCPMSRGTRRPGGRESGWSAAGESACSTCARTRQQATMLLLSATVLKRRPAA